jgi:hypothetical protein
LLECRGRWSVEGGGEQLVRLVVESFGQRGEPVSGFRLALPDAVSGSNGAAASASRKMRDDGIEPVPGWTERVRRVR